MRLQQAAWILLFVCFVAGWGYVARLSSQPSQQPKQTEAPNGPSEKAYTDHPLKNFWDWTTRDAVSFYTFMLAIFTGTLGVSTILLWRATIRSAKISERALTELERPYLFILDFNWILSDPPETDGNEPGWAYTVANGGRLPAIIKCVSSGFKFGDVIPLLEDQPPIHELLTAPLLAAGDRRRIIQRFEDGSGYDPHEVQIRGGKAIIPGLAFAAGRMIAKISIEYDGPMTSGHITIACWEWHPVKYAFTQHGGAEHNRRT